MKTSTKYALGAGAGIGLLLLFGASTTYSYGGPDKGILNRNPAMLLPSFAARLNTLFARMRAAGWDPLLNEGYRTPDRAVELSKTGAGIADSMHTYQAAADIKSESQNWSNPNFFNLLGVEAEKLGLTWGGRFSKPDATHVQAVPVNQQNMLAQLYRSSPAAADAFAKQQMDRMQAVSFMRAA